ncbi:hypothetical protein MMC24_002364 [Lignoscripta atroalba]|nr:hypothetical protein [Lignoscripta atroalba]
MPSFIRPPESPFDPPSLLYQIVSSPLRTLVQLLYHVILLLRGPPFHPLPLKSRIRIVCISDTHTRIHSPIPFGDVLIHAGDLSNLGTTEEIQAQINWLVSLPHPHKIVIAGNHDSFLDPRSRYASESKKALDWRKIHYLQHSSITLAFPEHLNRRLNVYGAPQIPECGGPEFAFQYHRHEDAWSRTVPKETNILITHTPPRHHLDLPEGLGCKYLLKELWRVRPRLHVFGHVHAGHGRESVFWDDGQRAYERICARENSGILRDLIAVRAWIDVLQVVCYGILGILWTRVWGADDNGGIMINAALSYRNTGKLGNPPQVVDI